MNDTTSSNLFPTTAPPGAELTRTDVFFDATPETDAQRSNTLDAQRPNTLDAQRVTLAWTDPEDGATLWVELWGSPELVAELVDQGFARRDEPSADEFLDLPFLMAPAPSPGAHLRARILHPRRPGAG